MKENKNFKKTKGNLNDEPDLVVKKNVKDSESIFLRR